MPEFPPRTPAFSFVFAIVHCCVKDLDAFDKNTKNYGWAIDRTRFLNKILLTVNVVAGVRTVTNRG